MIKVTRHIVIFFYVMTCITFYSCRFFTEPDPYVNKSAISPQAHYKTASLVDYSVDQIVSGTITPHFLSDISLTNLDSIFFCVDSIRVLALHTNNLWSGTWDYIHSNYDFSFDVNTNLWSNGKHSIIIYSYARPTLNDSLGLFSLVTNTLFVYQTSLIFDNASPAASTNNSRSIRNKNSLLSWF